MAKKRKPRKFRLKPLLHGEGAAVGAPMIRSKTVWKKKKRKK